jgi:transcriptional regulator with XRE-family HTH domain
MSCSGSGTPSVNWGRVRMPSRRAKKRAEVVRLFAERLRVLRRSRGMTQAELARLAEVSVTHLSELENAEIAPGIDLVDRLARALGAAVADLLPSTAPEPLPVLRAQAERLFATLLERGDRDTFLRLNPFLALLVEAAAKRR